MAAAEDMLTVLKRINRWMAHGYPIAEGCELKSEMMAIIDRAEGENDG